MPRQRSRTLSQAALKASVRKRIRSLYRSFDLGEWERCYAFIDPVLRAASRIEPERYAESLGVFSQRYGKVNIWFIGLSLHTGTPARRDARPFAYAYVLWQDDRKAFHLFRERWVYHVGRWYTRVVGLVAYEEADGRGE